MVMHRTTRSQEHVTLLHKFDISLPNNILLKMEEAEQYLN